MSLPYWARPTEDRQTYIWNGIEYPRVTAILGSSGGQYLIPWSGKMAALRAAAHLYQAGVESSDEDLKAFMDTKVERDLSMEQAHAEIMHWASVMREGERYRDHKARIGSLVHHWAYQHAFGLRVKPRDMEDHLMQSAMDLDLLPDATVPMLQALAHSAYAYVLSYNEWVENAMPEWEMIGLEACVIRFYTFTEEGESRDDGYAGTTDGKFTLQQSVYEKSFDWPEAWPRNKTSRRVDFKTSNRLPQTVQAQCEAYDCANIIGLVKTGEEFAIEESDGTACLHIGPHASAARVSDEYGVLASKAQISGAKLLTWPKSRKTFEAFMGLVKWFNWGSDLPKPDQAKVRKPKERRPTKFDEKVVPF
jgi:hypothetical protein